VEEMVILESDDELINIDTIENDVVEEITPFEETSTVINNYNYLINKPQINDVELINNKTLDDLNIQGKMEYLSNLEIEKLIGGL
jgi:outer membrane cobalamin receptor